MHDAEMDQLNLRTRSSLCSRPCRVDRGARDKTGDGSGGASVFPLILLTLFSLPRIPSNRASLYSYSCADMLTQLYIARRLCELPVRIGEPRTARQIGSEQIILRTRFLPQPAFATKSESICCQCKGACLVLSFFNAALMFVWIGRMKILELPSQLPGNCATRFCYRNAFYLLSTLFTRHRENHDTWRDPPTSHEAPHLSPCRSLAIKKAGSGLYIQEDRNTKIPAEISTLLSLVIGTHNPSTQLQLAPVQ